MKIIRVLVLIFLCMQSTAYAAKRYIIGVEDYVKYPFQTTLNGEYNGKFKDILDKFAKSEGIEFEYKPYKLNRLYEEFYKGMLDFKFPDNPVWQSPQKVEYKIYYSNFFTHYIDGIFVRKQDVAKTLGKLETIGVVDDILPWVINNKEQKGKIKIVKSQSCAELISLIHNGEIDAIFCNYDVMRFLLQGVVPEKELIFNINLPFTDNYLYISTIKHPEILEKLNKWISENRELIERETHVH